MKQTKGEKKYYQDGFAAGNKDAYKNFYNMGFKDCYESFLNGNPVNPAAFEKLRSFFNSYNARKRWKKTTKKQRIAYSKMMNEARKSKQDERES